MWPKIQTGKWPDTKTWFYIGPGDYGLKFGMVLFDHWFVLFDKFKKQSK